MLIYNSMACATGNKKKPMVEEKKVPAKGGFPPAKGGKKAPAKK